MVSYWLMKSEPDVYPFSQLVADGSTHWDGVRNYQARNMMRDDMKVGIAISKQGWDSKMIAYPNVFEIDQKLVMLYNGNGFGKTGFGYAVLNKSL